MQIYYNTLFFIYGFVLIICDNTLYLRYLHFVVILIGISFIIDFLIIKKRGLYLNLFFKIYLFFLILAIVSSFWSTSFIYSLKKSMTLVMIFLNILIVYNINKKYNNFIYLIYGFFFAIIVNFFWLLGLIDLGLTYEGWRFQGSVLQANNFVFILIFVLLMIIYLLNSANRKTLFKSIMLLLILMTLYMIFFTASKSGLITSTILIGLYFYLQVSSKNIRFLSLMVFSIYVLFTYTSFKDLILENTTLDVAYTIPRIFERINIFSSIANSDNLDVGGSTGDRIRMLHDAFDLWVDAPLFGNGIAAFEIKYGRYSHNNVMEILVSLGFVGLFLFYSLYGYLFLMIKEIDKSKSKIMFYVFIIVFLLFDQSIVSYTGKFKILALLILFLIIQESRGSNKLSHEN